MIDKTDINRRFTVIGISWSTENDVDSADIFSVSPFALFWKAIRVKLGPRSVDSFFDFESNGTNDYVTGHKWVELEVFRLKSS